MSNTGCLLTYTYLTIHPLPLHFNLESSAAFPTPASYPSPSPLPHHTYTTIAVIGQQSFIHLPFDRTLTTTFSDPIPPSPPPFSPPFSLLYLNANSTITEKKKGWERNQIANVILPLFQDRPLQHINKKGRPVSQCQHCRTMRKARSSHVKCDCGEKTHKCAHLQPTIDGHKGEPTDLDMRDMFSLGT